jgi:hypothetical protein
MLMKFPLLVPESIPVARLFPSADGMIGRSAKDNPATGDRYAIGSRATVFSMPLGFDCEIEIGSFAQCGLMSEDVIQTRPS